MTYVLLIAFLVCSLLLILLILIQKGRGAGLAGAFGGGGGQSAFGTRTADILTKATGVLTAVFFLLALFTGWYMNRSVSSTGGSTPTQSSPTEPTDTPAEGAEGTVPAVPSDVPATPPVPATETAPAAPAAEATPTNGASEPAPNTDGGQN
ncbi:MAG: preprotein translocase subunit SecG [Phycisphaerae bacterium]|nr:preprotein translocase subunit SecG [Phycisphaerae bacterium]